MTKSEAVKYIIFQVAKMDVGDITPEELFDIIESYVKMVQMTSEKPEGVKCPECGGEMISRKGKYGVFWGCRSYPKCNGTRDSEGKSKYDREQERLEKESERAPYEPMDDKFRFRKG